MGFHSGQPMRWEGEGKPAGELLDKDFSRRCVCMGGKGLGG